MAENCPFEIAPLAQSKIKTVAPFKNLDYTNQDYWSMKKKVLEIIRKNFGDEFNDFSEASLGVMLLECWLFVADTLSFKIDQIANELFIDTVTETENAFRLSKLVGFRPTPPGPARAFFITSITSPQQEDLIIGTPLTMRLESLQYELFSADAQGNPIYGEPIIIPTGKTYNKSVVGIEGKSLLASFTSNGQSYQIIQIPKFPIYFDSIQLSVDGVLWERVETFNGSGSKMEYRVEWGINYQPFIVFGNNKSGMIPPEGSRILVRYRTGLGSEGNVVTGAFDDKVFLVVPGLDHRITVFVKNYTKGEHGYNGDGIEEIRQKLPLYLGVQNRAVTGSDYKLIAEQFQTLTNGLVGKATAILRNHGCAGNVIDLYIVAKDENDDLIKPTANLKDALANYLDEKKVFTDHVCIKDGDIIYVDIHIDLMLDRSHKKFEKDLQERVDRRIDDFFRITSWDFGKPLLESDIIKILSDLREVSSVNVNFTSNKNIETDNSNYLDAKYYEIIRPDNIFVSFSYRDD